MEHNDNDFLLGQLSAKVEALTGALDTLTTEMRGLKRELNNINLFRAKVLGMSIGASAVVSALAFVVEQAVHAWAK